MTWAANICLVVDKDDEELTSLDDVIASIKVAQTSVTPSELTSYGESKVPSNFHDALGKCEILKNLPEAK